ncbi:MAG TPA: ATP phosphoribosyltransferase regulatory subunit [Eubacteriales bacterium]|jgi:ATP phosphoribosyltransferase regulatory subunit|nr:ATP phosphoribosyltransferase regulatory subunit [Clostridia bacterium]HRR89179.1 ATP phosphoribosyltransferase regulatory subunit [Eubacteriales bacterium]HRU83815.1 ATP phosphoribosyltransferase regulatory subunit [Eubacteriales bacterium]
MKIGQDKLKKDEKLVLELREVFESYGFSRFKMSKFEEYVFYLENKNFLKTEQIITFTDRGGRLLALKPDITLSIAKTFGGKAGETEKVYYIENVYRYLKHTDEYRETEQMGLEVMGAVDTYSELEVILLAMKSLELIDKNYVLDISHIGLTMGLFESLGIEDGRAREALQNCISQKNGHDIEAAAPGISAAALDAIRKVIALPGDIGEALAVLEGLSSGNGMSQAISELKSLWNALKTTKYARRAKLDLSISGDVNYYNGIIFRGYVEKIPVSVLSGGRYDLLIQKFKKEGGAVGFALNLDDLALYYPRAAADENEVYLVYGEDADAGAVAEKAAALVKEGYIVKAQRTPPKNADAKTIEFRGRD